MDEIDFYSVIEKAGHTSESLAEHGEMVEGAFYKLQQLYLSIQSVGDVAAAEAIHHVLEECEDCEAKDLLWQKLTELTLNDSILAEFIATSQNLDSEWLLTAAYARPDIITLYCVLIDPEDTTHQSKAAELRNVAEEVKLIEFLQDLDVDMVVEVLKHFLFEKDQPTLFAIKLAEMLHGGEAQDGFYDEIAEGNVLEPQDLITSISKRPDVAAYGALWLDEEYLNAIHQISGWLAISDHYIGSIADLYRLNLVKNRELWEGIHSITSYKLNELSQDLSTAYSALRDNQELASESAELSDDDWHQFQQFAAAEMIKTQAAIDESLHTLFSSAKRVKTLQLN